MKYRITVNGFDWGIYDEFSEYEALNSFAQDVGYVNYRTMLDRALGRGIRTLAITECPFSWILPRVPSQAKEPRKRFEEIITLKQATM